MVRRLLIVAAALATLSASIGARGGQDTSASAIADRLRSYIQDLEPKLSALVAGERFEQTITTVDEHGQSHLSTRRVLASDIGFIRLPDDHAWLGHRRVRTINGRAVDADAPRLEDLFIRTGSDRFALARRIANENARHNLGHPRTTNVPTLPLDLLHPRHESAYRVTMGDENMRDGVRVARLAFREDARGAIVAYDGRSFVRTAVIAWVEVATGALQRAEVTLEPPQPIVARENHVVSVEFAMHPQLGLRVPVRLTERFWAGGKGDGKAVYDNYRRFDTAARIVPPPP
jgi:hypothetical protein